ncbi:recombinase RecT [Helcococcus sueciensis]|uniref:recombinase RecT n=1 Tax=Helcococcus sueciensis TaxID=241555 RepID=UPI0003FA2290|nr:recombinase RecT [Helcococcus sueciensis]
MAQAKELLENKTNNTVKKSEKQTMENLLTLMADEIKKALPENVKSERFRRIALTAFNGNKDLQQCEPTSFLAAMMQSAQLGLEPNTPLGQAYLIPYNNSKKNIKEVQFQVGYKGMLDLAHRTNQYKNIQANIVYEKDEFDIEYGLNPKLKHIPNMKEDRGQAIGYYAVYNLINGGQGFEYMTRAEVEKHAQKFSKTYRNGPWQTDFDEMAKKTVLKKVLKYAPMSTELQEATAIDERVVNEENIKSKNEDKFVDVDWSYVDDVEEDVIE